MDVRTVSRDEEGKKKVERVPLPKTRHPETVRYFERKLEDKGLHRLERHPADGLGGIGAPPPKSGHGGKFTWEGPDDLVESELEPVPPAIDPNDPNYVDDDEEEGVAAEGGRRRKSKKGQQQAGGAKEEEEEEVAKEVIVGEVEVAKVAEAREGVSRVDVVPPLQP